MKKNHIPVLRAFIAGLTSAVLTFALASPASAASDVHSKMAHNWVGHQAHLQAHLEKEAARLGITASQQAQWQAYVGAVESPIDNMYKLPPDADAVSIARQRADMAAGRAAKLVRIADATAALQAVLTPEQGSLLARMVRHDGPHGWHEARDRDRPHPGKAGPADAPAE
jgi:LTXXQ motif family protein